MILSQELIPNAVDVLEMMRVLGKDTRETINRESLGCVVAPIIVFVSKIQNHLWLCSISYCHDLPPDFNSLN